MLDDLSGGFADNVDPRARMVTGSIVDHDAVDALFAPERFEHVFHVAAYAAEGLSPFIKRFNGAAQRGAARLLRPLQAAPRVRGQRQVDLREGVRRMANWAREHGARETSLFAGIEIERGLPEGWAQLRSG